MRVKALAGFVDYESDDVATVIVGKFAGELGDELKAQATEPASLVAFTGAGRSVFAENAAEDLTMVEAGAFIFDREGQGGARVTIADDDFFRLIVLVTVAVRVQDQFFGAGHEGIDLFFGGAAIFD